MLIHTLYVINGGAEMIKVSDVRRPQKKDLKAIDWMIKRIKHNSQLCINGTYVSYHDVMNQREYINELIRARTSKENLSRNIKSLLDTTTQLLPFDLYNEYIQMHGLSTGVEYNGYKPRGKFRRAMIVLLTALIVGSLIGITISIVFHLSAMIMLILSIVCIFILAKAML